MTVLAQMKRIVPYSNENAETIAQVIITECKPQEEHFVELGMAIYGSSKSEMEKIVQDAIGERKKNIVADIVTFRAEAARALQTQPRNNGATDEKKGEGP